MVAATQQILDTICLNKSRHHTQIGDLIHALQSHLFCIVCFCPVHRRSPAPAQSPRRPYDGLWNVTIVTKTGTCEPQTRSTLTVTDGKVSAAGADVTGSIGREGVVKVSIGGAYANGQLSGNSGSGKWNGASAGVPCSGRWEASRQ